MFGSAVELGVEEGAVASGSVKADVDCSTCVLEGGFASSEIVVLG